MALIYNDWEITKRHAKVVEELLPPTLRQPQVLMNIPGFSNGRIGPDFKAGVYLMPHSSPIGMTFSNLQDVNYSSLLVAATGKTSNQSADVPPLMLLTKAIRTAFASRRILKLAGELYSSQDAGSYDLDQEVARKLDVVQFILTSRIREDRP